MVDYCDILIQAIDTIASSNNEVAQQASTVDETIEPTIKDANPFADILITQNQKTTYTDEANEIESGNQIPMHTWSLIGAGEKFELLGVEMVVSTTISSNDADIPDDNYEVETVVSLSNTDAPSGNYGVEIVIYGDNKRWTSIFNSSEMLGDVYGFNKMLQKKIFDVSEISDIAYIEAKVYNNTSGVTLKLHSLEMVLGQNLNNVGEDSEPLSLSVTSEGKYETSAAGTILKGGTQNFSVRYVYQQTNGKYRSVTVANQKDRPDNMSLRWYRYSEMVGGDEYGGANWEYLPDYENRFQTGIGMRPDVEEERFKVVALVESEDAQQVNVIESEEVVVTNIKAVSENFISRMELKFSDRSGGTYPYYALDNYIEEAYITKPTENRTVKVDYKLAIEDSDLFANISKVVWYYTQNVIINRTSELNSWTSEQSADGDLIIVTLTKKEVTVDEKEDTSDELEVTADEKEDAAGGLEEALKLVYSIPNTRAEMASEGIVKCKIELVDGTSFEASKDIYLTFNGNAGTDYTVITRIYDENYVAQKAYLVNGGNQYLKVKVYDVEGQEITADVQDISVKDTSVIEDEDTSVIEDEDTSVIRKSAIADGATNENQGFKLNDLTLEDTRIVKVTCKIAEKDTSKSLNIEELVPIPVTSSLDYTYLGPSKIMYDSSGGSPQYNKSALTLLGVDPESSITWELVQSKALEVYGLLSALNENIFTPVSNYDPVLEMPVVSIPVVKEDTDSEEPVEDSDSEEPVEDSEELVAIDNISAIKAEGLYTQPLVFYQNRYFSRIINEWDGKLQVNKEGNYVLASAYVAGSKNNENKFTGAILGELGTLTDNSTKESGLFGYNNGTQTFGLKTDGSAFFGASGSGRINFNASGKGVIESGGYTPKTESALGKGTRIDLATGSFDFGGGRITYDGEQSLTLAGVTLSWEDVEDKPPTIYTELSEDVEFIEGDLLVPISDIIKDDKVLYSAGKTYQYKKSEIDQSGTWVPLDYTDENSVNALDNKLEAMLTGGQNTEIEGDYVISPYIGGGYLHITGDGKSVIIDPQGKDADNTENWIFRIVNENNTVMGVDADGNAEFNGIVTTAEGKIGGWTIGKNSLVKAPVIEENTAIREEPTAGNKGKKYVTVKSLGFGMRALPPDSDKPNEDPVFAIGWNGIPPQNDDDYTYIIQEGSVSTAYLPYWASAPFCVYQDGSVTARNIKITGGKIGDWTLSGGSFGYNQSEALLSLFSTKGQNVYLGKDEILIADLTEKKRYYTSLKPGAIISAMNTAQGDDVKDYPTGFILRNSGLYFYDFRINKETAGFENLENIPTGLSSYKDNEDIYGYIGIKEVYSLSHRGIIANFDLIPSRKSDSESSYIGEEDNRFSFAYFDQGDFKTGYFDQGDFKTGYFDTGYFDTGYFDTIYLKKGGKLGVCYEEEENESFSSFVGKEAEIVVNKTKYQFKDGILVNVIDPPSE